MADEENLLFAVSLEAASRSMVAVGSTRGEIGVKGEEGLTGEIGVIGCCSAAEAAATAAETIAEEDDAEESPPATNDDDKTKGRPAINAGCFFPSSFAREWRDRNVNGSGEVRPRAL